MTHAEKLSHAPVLGFGKLAEPLAGTIDPPVVQEPTVQIRVQDGHRALGPLGRIQPCWRREFLRAWASEYAKDTTKRVPCIASSVDSPTHGEE